MSVVENNIYLPAYGEDTCYASPTRPLSHWQTHPYPACDYGNRVKMWRTLQGWHGGRAPRRRVLDVRYARIENAGRHRVGVAINIYWHDAPACRVTKPSFFLEPGETIELGLNLNTGPAQTLWLFDEQGNLVNTPHLIKNNVNQLVLREGMNLWFVQDYKWGA